MNLKAILCDFDGTLVDKDLKYSLQVKTLISKIKSKKIRFSLATGRAYYGPVQKFLDELKLYDYHIFHGGAMIYHNKTKNTLLYQPISEQSVEKIVNYFKTEKLFFGLETKKSVYLSKLAAVPTYINRESSRHLKELKNYKDVLKIVITININNLSEAQVEKHIDYLTKSCKDISILKIKIINFGLDITSEKATKHTAVLEYERLLNIPRQQIVAIGDGYNDYPLFTACDYKIAMENAPQELKEIADFIAPTVDNNGTEVALQHIISKFL